MEFGILFTSQPNHDAEPYPHRAVHKRVTDQIVAADAMGYDYAWLAEHHFSNKYGIMPDIFVYAAHIAALTKNIKIGAGIVTVPLTNPVRIVENSAFVDILSNGRFAMGFGSGYRPYEFEGFGVPFEARRDIQEETIPLIMEMLRTNKINHAGKFFNHKIDGDYEIFPRSIQRPHPPIYLAAATERSLKVTGEQGFGLLLSSLSPFKQLKKDVDIYVEALGRASAEARTNPACGVIDISRWIYVAETDAQARADTEEGILRHFAGFDGKKTVGYMGTVGADESPTYESLTASTIVHGSPETVYQKLVELHDLTGYTSLMLQNPPYYGTEKLNRSYKLFATEVMPRLRELVDMRNLAVAS